MRLMTLAGRSPKPGMSCARWTASIRLPMLPSGPHRGPNGCTSMAAPVMAGCACISPSWWGRDRRRRGNGWPACACSSSATAGRPHTPRAARSTKRRCSPALPIWRLPATRCVWMVSPIESRWPSQDWQERSCSTRHLGARYRRLRFAARVAGCRATSCRCSPARCGPRFRSDATGLPSTMRPAITITTGDSGKAFGGNGARWRRTRCLWCTAASFRRPPSPTPRAFQDFWRCSAAMGPSGFRPTSRSTRAVKRDTSMSVRRDPRSSYP